MNDLNSDNTVLALTVYTAEDIENSFRLRRFLIQEGLMKIAEPYDYKKGWLAFRITLTHSEAFEVKNKWDKIFQ